MGDVNFSAAQAGVASAALRRPERMLPSALSRRVELVAPEATQIIASSGAFSAIDGVLVLVPWSLLAVAQPRAMVGAQPEWMFAEGLGDHPPVIIESTQRGALPEACPAGCCEGR